MKVLGTTKSDSIAKLVSSGFNESPISMLEKNRGRLQTLDLMLGLDIHMRAHAHTQVHTHSFAQLSLECSHTRTHM